MGDDEGEGGRGGGGVAEEGVGGVDVGELVEAAVAFVEGDAGSRGGGGVQGEGGEAELGGDGGEGGGGFAPLAEDVELSVLVVAAEEDPDGVRGRRGDGVLRVVGVDELFGVGGGGPGEVVVLAVGEEGGVPVDVEGVEVLEDVFEGHPEHVGHVLVGGAGRVDAEAGGGADAGPYQAVAPGVLDEEEAVVAVGFEVEDGVVVLFDEAEGFLFLGGDVAGA